jgi:peptidoglycan/xylan/chitin deacetylase (PgdA/CDA1 family)
MQINLLRAAGFHFVTMTALARMAEGGAQPPPRYAGVTFDDGLHSNYTTALPILSELPPTRTIVAVPGACWYLSVVRGQAASSTYKIRYYTERY